MSLELMNRKGALLFLAGLACCARGGFRVPHAADDGSVQTDGSAQTDGVDGNEVVPLDSIEGTDAARVDTIASTDAAPTADGGQTPAGYAGFIPTTTTFTETDDIEVACVAEHGTAAQLADWEQVKQLADISAFAQGVGLVSWRDGVMVQRAGIRFYDNTRHYFIELHNHNVPPSFFVHDDIATNFISLGSWHGMNKRVLCHVE